MKIKEDLMLRNIAGTWVVVPMGERLLELNGMIKINESGALVWRLLEKGSSQEEIIAAFLEEYEVDEVTAAQEVETFIKTLEDANVLEA